jgi:hypothetical protein
VIDSNRRRGRTAEARVNRHPLTENNVIDLPNRPPSDFDGPEWVIGDAADREGYVEDDTRLYLLHVDPPRFLVAWDAGAEDLDLADLQIEIAWLDDEPPPDEMSELMATVARILGTCHVDDRRIVEEDDE